MSMRRGLFLRIFAGLIALSMLAGCVPALARGVEAALPAMGDRADGFVVREVSRLEMADADLVLFDPGRVIDRGTFAKPDIYPVGIDLVVVNGNIAMEDGKLTAARSGRVIRA